MPQNTASRRWACMTGFGFYHDVKFVCGEVGNNYCHTKIMKGRYASVTINDPFSFSAWHVWNYIAGWMRENDVNIRLINLSGAGVPFFVKYNRQAGSEYMSVYVPIE